MSARGTLANPSRSRAPGPRVFLLLDDGYEVHVVDNLAPYTGAKDPAAGWPLFDPRSYSNFIFAQCVYLSSSAAYPIKHQRHDHFELLTEDLISFESDIGMPDLTYGWAKLTGEYLALLAYERHGIESAVYRPFSGYGEDQDDAYPFPSICKRAIECRNDSSMTVWGSGLQMRDFIHIDDCVAGILPTMDALNGDSTCRRIRRPVAQSSGAESSN